MKNHTFLFIVFSACLSILLWSSPSHGVEDHGSETHARTDLVPNWTTRNGSGWSPFLAVPSELTGAQWAMKHGYHRVLDVLQFLKDWDNVTFEKMNGGENPSMFTNFLIWRRGGDNTGLFEGNKPKTEGIVPPSIRKELLKEVMMEYWEQYLQFSKKFPKDTDGLLSVQNVMLLDEIEAYFKANSISVDGLSAKPNSHLAAYLKLKLEAEKKGIPGVLSKETVSLSDLGEWAAGQLNTTNGQLKKDLESVLRQAVRLSRVFEGIPTVVQGDRVEDRAHEGVVGTVPRNVPFVFLEGRDHLHASFVGPRPEASKILPRNWAQVTSVNPSPFVTLPEGANDEVTAFVHNENRNRIIEGLKLLSDADKRRDAAKRRFLLWGDLIHTSDLKQLPAGRGLVSFLAKYGRTEGIRKAALEALTQPAKASSPMPAFMVDEIFTLFHSVMAQQVAKSKKPTADDVYLLEYLENPAANRPDRFLGQLSSIAGSSKAKVGRSLATLLGLSADWANREDKSSQYLSLDEEVAKHIRWDQIIPQENIRLRKWITDWQGQQPNGSQMKEWTTILSKLSAGKSGHEAVTAAPSTARPEVTLTALEPVVSERVAQAPTGNGVSIVVPIPSIAIGGMNEMQSREFSQLLYDTANKNLDTFVAEAAFIKGLLAKSPAEIIEGLSSRYDAFLSRSTRYKSVSALVSEMGITAMDGDSAKRVAEKVLEQVRNKFAQSIEDIERLNASAGGEALPIPVLAMMDRIRPIEGAKPFSRVIGAVEGQIEERKLDTDLRLAVASNPTLLASLVNTNTPVSSVAEDAAKEILKNYFGSESKDPKDLARVLTVNNLLQKLLDHEEGRKVLGDFAGRHLLARGMEDGLSFLQSLSKNPNDFRGTPSIEEISGFKEAFAKGRSVFTSSISVNYKPTGCPSAPRAGGSLNPEMKLTIETTKENIETADLQAKVEFMDTVKHEVSTKLLAIERSNLDYKKKKEATESLLREYSELFNKIATEQLSAYSVEVLLLADRSSVVGKDLFLKKVHALLATTQGVNSSGELQSAIGRIIRREAGYMEMDFEKTLDEVLQSCSTVKTCPTQLSDALHLMKPLAKMSFAGVRGTGRVPARLVQVDVGERPFLACYVRVLNHFDEQQKIQEAAAPAHKGFLELPANYPNDPELIGSILLPNAQEFVRALSVLDPSKSNLEDFLAVFPDVGDDIKAMARKGGPDLVEAKKRVQAQVSAKFLSGYDTIAQKAGIENLPPHLVAMAGLVKGDFNPFLNYAQSEKSPLSQGVKGHLNNYVKADASTKAAMAENLQKAIEALLGTGSEHQEDLRNLVHRVVSQASENVPVTTPSILALMPGSARNHVAQEAFKRRQKDLVLQSWESGDPFLGYVDGDSVDQVATKMDLNAAVFLDALRFKGNCQQFIAKFGRFLLNSEVSDFTDGMSCAKNYRLMKLYETQKNRTDIDATAKANFQKLYDQYSRDFHAVGEISQVEFSGFIELSRKALYAKWDAAERSLSRDDGKAVLNKVQLGTLMLLQRYPKTNRNSSQTRERILSELSKFGKCEEKNEACDYLKTGRAENLERVRRVLKDWFITAYEKNSHGNDTRLFALAVALVDENDRRDYSPLYQPEIAVAQISEEGRDRTGNDAPTAHRILATLAEESAKAGKVFSSVDRVKILKASARHLNSLDDVIALTGKYAPAELRKLSTGEISMDLTSRLWGGYAMYTPDEVADPVERSDKNRDLAKKMVWMLETYPFTYKEVIGILGPYFQMRQGQGLESFLQSIGVVGKDALNQQMAPEIKRILLADLLADALGISKHLIPSLGNQRSNGVDSYVQSQAYRAYHLVNMLGVLQGLAKDRKSVNFEMEAAVQKALYPSGRMTFEQGAEVGEIGRILELARDLEPNDPSQIDWRELQNKIARKLFGEKINEHGFESLDANEKKQIEIMSHRLSLVWSWSRPELSEGAVHASVDKSVEQSYQDLASPQRPVTSSLLTSNDKVREADILKKSIELWRIAKIFGVQSGEEKQFQVSAETRDLYRKFWQMQLDNMKKFHDDRRLRSAHMQNVEKVEEGHRSAELIIREIIDAQKSWKDQPPVPKKYKAVEIKVTVRGGGDLPTDPTSPARIAEIDGFHEVIKRALDASSDDLNWLLAQHFEVETNPHEKVMEGYDNPTRYRNVFVEFSFDSGVEVDWSRVPASTTSYRGYSRNGNGIDFRVEEWKKVTGDEAVKLLPKNWIQFNGSRDVEKAKKEGIEYAEVRVPVIHNGKKTFATIKVIKDISNRKGLFNIVKDDRPYWEMKIDGGATADFRAKVEDNGWVVDEYRQRQIQATQRAHFRNYLMLELLKVHEGKPSALIQLGGPELNEAVRRKRTEDVLLKVIMEVDRQGTLLSNQTGVDRTHDQRIYGVDPAVYGKEVIFPELASRGNVVSTFFNSAQFKGEHVDQSIAHKHIKVLNSKGEPVEYHTLQGSDYAPVSELGQIVELAGLDQHGRDKRNAKHIHSLDPVSRWTYLSRHPEQAHLYDANEDPNSAGWRANQALAGYLNGKFLRYRLKGVALGPEVNIRLAQLPALTAQMLLEFLKYVDATIEGTPKLDKDGKPYKEFGVYEQSLLEREATRLLFNPSAMDIMRVAWEYKPVREKFLQFIETETLAGADGKILPSYQLADGTQFDAKKILDFYKGFDGRNVSENAALREEIRNALVSEILNKDSKLAPDLAVLLSFNDDFNNWKQKDVDNQFAKGYEATLGNNARYQHEYLRQQLEKERTALLENGCGSMGPKTPQCEALDLVRSHLAAQGRGMPSASRTGFLDQDFTGNHVQMLQRLIEVLPNVHMGADPKGEKSVAPKSMLERILAGGDKKQEIVALGSMEWDYPFYQYIRGFQQITDISKELSEILVKNANNNQVIVSNIWFDGNRIVASNDVEECGSLVTGTVSDLVMGEEDRNEMDFKIRQMTRLQALQKSLGQLMDPESKKFPTPAEIDAAITRNLPAAFEEVNRKVRLMAVQTLIESALTARRKELKETRGENFDLAKYEQEGHLSRDLGLHDVSSRLGCQVRSLLTPVHTVNAVEAMRSEILAKPEAWGIKIKPEDPMFAATVTEKLKDYLGTRTGHGELERRQREQFHTDVASLSDGYRVEQGKVTQAATMAEFYSQNLPACLDEYQTKEQEAGAKIDSLTVEIRRIKNDTKMDEVDKEIELADKEAELAKAKREFLAYSIELPMINPSDETMAHVKAKRQAEEDQVRQVFLNRQRVSTMRLMLQDDGVVKGELPAERENLETRIKQMNEQIETFKKHSKDKSDAITTMQIIKMEGQLERLRGQLKQVEADHFALRMEHDLYNGEPLVGDRPAKELDPVEEEIRSQMMTLLDKKIEEINKDRDKKLPTLFPGEDFFTDLKKNPSLLSVLDPYLEKVIDAHRVVEGRKEIVPDHWDLPGFGWDAKVPEYGKTVFNGKKEITFREKLKRIQLEGIIDRVRIAMMDGHVAELTNVLETIVPKDQARTTSDQDDQLNLLAKNCFKKWKELRLQLPTGSQPSAADEKLLAEAIEKWGRYRYQARQMVLAMFPPPGTEPVELKHAANTSFHELIKRPEHAQLFDKLKEELGDFMSPEALLKVMEKLHAEEKVRWTAEDSRLKELLARLEPLGFKWNGISLDMEHVALWKIGQREDTVSEGSCQITEKGIKDIKVKRLSNVDGKCPTLPRNQLPEDLKCLLQEFGELGNYRSRGKDAWDDLTEQMAQTYSAAYAAQFQFGDTAVRVMSKKEVNGELVCDKPIHPELNPEGRGDTLATDVSQAHKYLCFQNLKVAECRAQQDADRLEKLMADFQKQRGEVLAISSRLFSVLGTIGAEKLSDLFYEKVFGLKDNFESANMKLHQIHDEIHQLMLNMKNHGTLPVFYPSPRESEKLKHAMAELEKKMKKEVNGGTKYLELAKELAEKKKAFDAAVESEKSEKKRPGGETSQQTAAMNVNLMLQNFLKHVMDPDIHEVIPEEVIANREAVNGFWKEVILTELVYQPLAFLGSVKQAERLAALGQKSTRARRWAEISAAMAGTRRAQGFVQNGLHLAKEAAHGAHLINWITVATHELQRLVRSDDEYEKSNDATVMRAGNAQSRLVFIALPFGSKFVQQGQKTVFGRFFNQEVVGILGLGLTSTAVGMYNGEDLKETWWHHALSAGVFGLPWSNYLGRGMSSRALRGGFTNRWSREAAAALGTFAVFGSFNQGMGFAEYLLQGTYFDEEGNEIDLDLGRIARDSFWQSLPMDLHFANKARADIHGSLARNLMYRQAMPIGEVVDYFAGSKPTERQKERAMKWVHQGLGSQTMVGHRKMVSAYEKLQALEKPSARQIARRDALGRMLTDLARMQGFNSHPEDPAKDRREFLEAVERVSKGKRWHDSLFEVAGEARSEARKEVIKRFEQDDKFTLKELLDHPLFYSKDGVKVKSPSGEEYTLLEPGLVLDAISELKIGELREEFHSVDTALGERVQTVVRQAAEGNGIGVPKDKREGREAEHEEAIKKFEKFFMIARLSPAVTLDRLISVYRDHSPQGIRDLIVEGVLDANQLAQFFPKEQIREAYKQLRVYDVIDLMSRENANVAQLIQRGILSEIPTEEALVEPLLRDMSKVAQTHLKQMAENMGMSQDAMSLATLRIAKFDPITRTLDASMAPKPVVELKGAFLIRAGETLKAMSENGDTAATAALIDSSYYRTPIGARYVPSRSLDVTQPKHKGFVEEVSGKYYDEMSVGLFEYKNAFSKAKFQEGAVEFIKTQGSRFSDTMSAIRSYSESLKKSQETPVVPTVVPMASSN